MDCRVLFILAAFILSLPQSLHSHCYQVMESFSHNQESEHQILKRVWPGVKQGLNRAFEARALHHLQIGAKEKHQKYFEASALSLLREAIRLNRYEDDWQLTEVENREAERRHYTSILRWQRALTAEEQKEVDFLFPHIANLIFSKKEELKPVYQGIRKSIASLHMQMSKAQYDMEFRRRAHEVKAQIEFILRQVVLQYPYNADHDTLKLRDTVTAEDHRRIAAVNYYTHLIIPRLRQWSLRLNRSGDAGKFGADFGYDSRRHRRRDNWSFVSMDAPLDSDESRSSMRVSTIPGRERVEDLSTVIASENSRAANAVLDISGILPLSSSASLWVFKNLGEIHGVIHRGKPSLEEGLNALVAELSSPNPLYLAANALAYLTPRKGNPEDLVESAQEYISSLPRATRESFIQWLTEPGSERMAPSLKVQRNVRDYWKYISLQEGDFVGGSSESIPLRFRGAFLNTFMISRLAKEYQIEGRTPKQTLEAIRNFFESQWVSPEEMRDLHLSLMTGVDKIKAKMSDEQRQSFQENVQNLRSKIQEFLSRNSRALNNSDKQSRTAQRIR